MDEADEGGSSSSRRTTTNPLDSFSKHLESFPRDLLQRFTSTTSTITTTTTATTAITSTSLSEYRTPNEETEELELSLGLSLGGRFGVDKSSKRLTRSTSIAGSFPLFREDEASATPSPLAHQPLVRSSSLPTETEEEWRKRKELQTLRRMEAKRRRSEKQRSLKIDKEDGRLEMESAQVGVLLAAKQGLGHSSSEGRSCLANQILQERSGQGAAGTSGPKAMGISIEEMRNPNTSESRSKEIGANAMEDMPCVFTKGEGPSGRRVDGILYKYGKGEEVRIMCICHGNFLSPAEFVRHAGGGDVAHPLRHIVVNPNPTAFPR